VPDQPPHDSATPVPASTPASLAARANALAARGAWPEAAVAFEGLAAATPGDAGGWIGAAKAHACAGAYRAMHAAAMRAAAIGTVHWPHALALARLLRDLHETRALAALASGLAAGAPAPTADDAVALAGFLGDQDLHAEALAWLDAALARDPGHAPARYLRGSTQLYMGHMDAARADLEEAVARAPHFAHAHWRLAQVGAPDAATRAARIARMRRERDRVAPGSEHDIHFSHALFAELHAQGDHEAAWPELARGIRAKRASIDYDAGRDAALLDAVARRCDAAFVDAPGHVDDGPVPVFIVGLFRSGSTVLERMLGGHPAIAEGGESMGFAAQLRLAADHRPRGVLDMELLERSRAVDPAALGAAFMAASSWRAGGRAFWTEKLPPNLLLAGIIARALPRARFVHAWRAPMDVCFSNLRMLYGGFAPWSYDQAELAAWHHAYARLAAHWRAVLGTRWLDVAHGELLADPEGQARRVLSHLGLDYDPRVLDLAGRGGAVSTASAAQVREGLRAPRAPEWWPYRRQLQPLARALGVAIDGAVAGSR
jgi:tetratricopeptide (TPR) repeat protein